MSEYLPLKACPLCGGHTGYHNKVLLEYVKNTNWLGTAFYLVRKGTHKIYRNRYCRDCGKCVSMLLDAPTFKL